MGLDKILPKTGFGRFLVVMNTAPLPNSGWWVFTISKGMQSKNNYTSSSETARVGGSNLA